MSTAEKIAETAPYPSLVVSGRQGQQAGQVIKIDPAKYLKSNGWVGRLLALGLLVMSLPVIVVFVVLVRLTSRGPGLYRQIRVGKAGRIFVMYKIRSMVQDAEAESGPVWTQSENDPRITCIGWFLRKSHLDELPQLINVVRGEMSLFGPRPERPELVHMLATSMDDYWDRLAVRPGITGLAQINLPPDTDIESVRRKLILDLEYIQTANLWMDVRMFLWTGLRLLAVPSTVATQLTGLARDVKPVLATTERPVSLTEMMQESNSQKNDGLHAV